MEKFHMIAGLPRSGSSLLCNILNSNPDFRATTTSGVIDVLRNMRSTFSHNITWKNQDRLELTEPFRKGMKGFLDGFYGEDKIVFDKCRGWSNNIALIDKILGNSDSKIIWTYRNPVDVMNSIEKRYQETILLENTDESNNGGMMSTLDRRVGAFINDNGIVNYPVEILADAIEMGYEDRIMVVTYHELCNKTQDTMNRIHKFVGRPMYLYPTEIKQTLHEADGNYNYKFMHDIKEGEIKYKEPKNTLPQKYVDIINNRFAGLNRFVFDGDKTQIR